jgi:signal transduction histidine kinase
LAACVLGGVALVGALDRLTPLTAPNLPAVVAAWTGALGLWLHLIGASALPARAAAVAGATALGAGGALLAGLTGGWASPALAAALWPLFAAQTGPGGLRVAIGAALAALAAAIGLGLATGATGGAGGTAAGPWLAALALGGGGLLLAGRLMEAGGPTEPDPAIAHAPAPASEPAPAPTPEAQTPPAPTPPATETVDPEVIARLKSAVAEADERADGRARFMAEMSHEIRTPLNAILGFADTMRVGVFGPLPPRYAEYAAHIHDSGSHLLDLVSDLLDLSKIDAGRYRLNPTPVDLGAMAQEAVRLSSGSAREKGVQLRVASGAAAKVEADARALRQMLLNLLSNAVKFTPAGGRVVVRAQPLADGGGLIEVADSGVGLTPEQLARVAEPYAQADNQPPGARGTGLGLALVKRLAELHGGRFELQSAPGEGTSARIVLPARPPESPESAEADAEALAPPADAPAA